MERACFGVGGGGQEDRKAGKWNAHFWFNYFGAIHARANSHPPFTPPPAPPTFLVPLIWKALVFHFAVCYLLFGIWYLLSTWNNSNPRFRWWSGRKMQGLWFAYAFVHNNMHIYIYIFHAIFRPNYLSKPQQSAAETCCRNMLLLGALPTEEFLMTRMETCASCTVEA